MKIRLVFLVMLVNSMFGASIASAELRPGFVKVGSENSCPKGKLDHWVVASGSDLVNLCGSNTYYTPFFFANYGDRVRVRVDCAGCQLSQQNGFDFKWWDAVQDYFRNSVDVEKYLEGKNAYVGDESDGICKDRWDKNDYWMKLYWKYTSKSGTNTWYFKPYFGEWVTCS